MGPSGFQYDRMVEDALRGVLRQALTVAAGQGLPGAHHFYITFRTDHPATRVPAPIRARYPEEMTIILQHQFWGLEVTEDWFEVTLSFNRVNQRLHIPFAAVTAFADPSEKFGLQFQAVESAAAPPSPEPVMAEVPQAESAAPAGEVIALDAFRKK